MVNGTIYDDSRISKVWLNKPNGNGVYVIDNARILVVHGNGFLSDDIIIYDNGTYGCNSDHSLSTHTAIKKAVNYILRGV